MCRSMVDIQSVALRLGKEKKIEEERRKKLQGKNIMAPLLHRAAIMKQQMMGWQWHHVYHMQIICILLQPCPCSPLVKPFGRHVQ